MLQNPSNLYSGGQVSLDSSPFVNHVLKLRALRDAKDEALDKYFTNLPNTVNEKGTRDQEIQLIHEGKDDLYKTYQQNKEAIKKGNTPEAFNFQKKLRELQGVVTKSQNETAKLNKVSSLLINPKYDYIRHDPQIVEQLRRSGLPVNDPEFQSLDVDKLAIPPAPFEQKKLDEFYTGKNALVPQVDLITTEKIPDDNLNKLQTTTYKFDKDALTNIYQDAASLLHSNYSFQKHLEKLDPFTVQKMNETFKKAYGYEPKSGEDVAAAYNLTGQLSRLTPKVEKIKDDKAILDYKQSHKKEMAALQNAYTTARMRERARLGLDNDPSTQGVAFDEIGGESDVDVFTTDSKFGIPYAKKGGRISKGIVFGADGDVMADGEITIDKDKLPANMIVVLNSQKTRLPNKVTATVKNGQIESVKSDNAGVVSRESMVNFQKGYNKEPQKGSQLQFGKKATVPTSTKKVKVKGL